jgi:hypothetical protein
MKLEGEIYFSVLLPLYRKLRNSMREKNDVSLNKKLVNI